MKTGTENSKEQGQVKRKASLSPELAEFLHMLNALEVELDTKAQPTR